MSAANSFINIGAAIVTHDLPIALGRGVKNELLWGRAVTVVIASRRGDHGTAIRKHWSRSSEFLAGACLRRRSFRRLR